MSNFTKIALEPFAYRHFQPDFAGTKIPIAKQEFVSKINDYYETCENAAEANGYAWFCKHLFVPNFVGATVGVVPITESNEHLLKTAYEARTPQELPVLTRFFPANKVSTWIAKYLDIILYHRQQVIKERTQREEELPLEQAEWYIVNIKAQDEDYELPMQPITIMRNACLSQGGSGIAIDRQQYMQSVHYWSQHATIK
ncbi:hypothetical protein GpartN1_g3688.t1 [Galdieria partita]|uniref:Uncharacterized protein n=1 Tax=Galdieria partita TaxID=83374 RepID=A0A9C7PXX6_9RHOD|nr:hypothetical protein GpartN1_g3688.t1 [Galdieria partita]